jgi:hypothetical protein
MSAVGPHWRLSRGVCLRPIADIRPMVALLLREAAPTGSKLGIGGQRLALLS